MNSSFINNTNLTGVNELTFGRLNTVATTPSILTNVTYVSNMFATVLFDDIKRKSTVTQDLVSGRALITFDLPAPAGISIQWKIFEKTTNERQALSKALKPRADN